MADVKAKYILDYLSRKLENNDENFEIIPFANGYTDQQGLFISSPKNRIEYKQTDVIPHEYDILAVPEKWLKFLDDVFDGDDDKDQKIAVIQEWFGYCMDRSLNLHKALVLYGDGGNGKSVILDVLAAIFPHITRLEWHELNEQRNLERLLHLL